jgi:hypothetical protein
LECPFPRLACIELGFQRSQPIGGVKLRGPDGNGIQDREPCHAVRAGTGLERLAGSRVSVMKASSASPLCSVPSSFKCFVISNRPFLVDAAQGAELLGVSSVPARAKLQFRILQRGKLVAIVRA